MVLPGIKNENKEKAVVFLAGLRLYEEGTINRVPTGAGETMLEKLWVFLLNFVGTSVNNQINKIEVFCPNDSLGCDCGAIVVKADEEAGVAEKLTRACTCRSASAIVYFVDPAAVRVLKANIRDHKKFHSDGIQTQLGIDSVDRSVSFCNVCCFLNRRVWVTTQQPSPRDSDDEDGGELEEDDRATSSEKSSSTPIVTENQLVAITTILTTVLGASLARQIVALTEGVRGANLSEMYEMVTNGVRELFSNKEIKTLLPVKWPEDKYKSIISKAIAQVVTETTPENSIQKATKWSDLYFQSTTGEVVWTEEIAGTEQEEIEIVGSTNNNNNGDNGDGKLMEEVSVPTVREEEVAATEENLDNLYKGVKAVMKVQETMDFDTMDTAAGAEATLKSMKQYKDKITVMFIKLDPAVTTRRGDDHEKLINDITLKAKMLHAQIQFFNSKTETPKVEKSVEKTTKSDDKNLPTKSEIARDLRIFEACNNTLNNSFSETREIVEDDDVEDNKNEFNTINTRVWPKVVRDMATLKELCNRFREWLRMPISEIITKEIRKKLQEKMKEEQQATVEYFRLEDLIALLDRKFSHAIKSYEDGGLSAMLIKEPIEPFYGEEPVPGKKWQNLFEWLRKVEMSICKAVNDKQVQLNQIMKLLSPNIQKIARAKQPEFKNYQELKTWLIKHHVNETKIIKDLQNRIATVVPTKMKEIEGYVIHTRGIMVTIQEHCDSNPRLKEKLLSERNVSQLVRFILKQVSHATNRDEFQYYLENTWGEYAEQLAEDGDTPTPTQVLQKVDEHLEKVLKLARVSDFYDMMNEEPSLHGPEKGGAGKYNDRSDRGRGNFRGKFTRGRGRGGAGKSSFSNGKGGGAYSSFNRTKTPVPYCLVLRGDRHDKFSNAAKIVTTNSSEGASIQEKKTRNNKGIYIQVSDSDLKKAKDWESKREKLTIACWMCTSPKPHELWSCAEATGVVSNWDRFKKARDKEFGPGTQCFSCLSAVCFLTRTLDAAKESKDAEQKHLRPCDNYKKKNINDIACVGCIEDANKSSNGLIKRQKPMHATICPKKEHLEDSKTRRLNINRLKDKFGKEAPKIRIQCVMAEPGMYPGAQANNINTSEGGQFKNDTKTKHSGRPALPTISEREYKGSENSKLFDTVNGSKTYLDLKKDEIARTLIKASKGTPLYFLQQFNLAGNNVLCFFDSGAMFNLIKTAIARILDLKMVSRKPMYVVGAGEHVHSTGDGKYEIVLGPGKHGERYVLEVAGSQELTGYMLEANFRECHDEVREEAKKHADHGLEVMEANEPLPMQVGGMKAGLIIGLPTPSLQPVIIMCLPSGLLVAKSRLTDIFGSRIVFGGMHDNYRKYFNLHQFDPQIMKTGTAEEFEVFHNACMEEYFNFRDSLRVDMVHLHQGKEYNPKWQDIIENETDAMAEDSLIIIAGSEEKRGEQLRKQQAVKRLINSGSKILYPKPVHMEEEPIEQFQVYSRKEKLVERKKQKPRKKESRINKQKAREELKNNILMENLEEVDAYYAKVEELVNERFDLKANEYPVQEGVYFDSDAEKISYYEEIQDDPELDDLLSKNTSVQVNTHQKCTIGKVGVDAFQTAAKPVLGLNANASVDIVEECNVDHGCACASGDLDAVFDKVVEGLTNSDREQMNKMKRAIRKWEDDETIGTGVDYRCSRCINCKECLKSGKTRARSQREEDEQRVIESSVRINWEEKKCYVFLPWIKSPQELALRWGAKSNLKQANHFLRKMLAKSSEDRASLARFWDELKSRNVVAKLRDLNEDLQKQIMSSAVLHFYPWNCVFKESITTPCRMVVDSRTSGLNDHLAKGLNTLNNLQQLLLKFRSYKYIGSFDISKMYNMLYIEESHLQYQLILWVDEMNPENEVEVWVMLRAIYGTVSSGNQAEVAIRRGATELEQEHPQGAHTIIHETYVDDGVPCRDNKKELLQALEEVKLILGKIGFGLKCITISGQEEPLSEKASSDKLTIGIAGYKYEPRADLLSLAFKECNFNKIVRGTKAPNKHPVVHGKDIDDEIFPDKLTRAACVGKLAECFDLIGLFMPLTMQGKIMARKIAHLDWSEYIPQDLMKDWLEICRKIQDVRHIKVKRCVIPETAQDPTSVDLMEVHDGSKEGAATVVYARCLLTDGSYSTKMLFSRSSLCPIGQDVPRNELTSSHLGATAAYITRVALAGKVKETYTFGDSYVALCWAENPNLKLRSWTFARVQDLRRLNGEAKAYWVRGTLNIADIATKGQVTVSEIDGDSAWHNGLEWMHLSIETMIEQEIILDFDKVMRSLNAKDKAVLREEQNPSLPDLATGSRKNKNPEFDIAVIGSPDSENISQNTFYQFHPELCQPVGATKDEISLNNPSSIEYPLEFYSGVWFGVTPEQMVRNFLTQSENLPSNSSLTAGGKKSKKAKVQFADQFSRWQVTKFGWATSFRASSVLAYFRMKCQHKTHQIPTPGHHLYGKLTPKQLHVRESLVLTCRVCKNAKKLSNEDVNMAYLDSLCSGKTPEVNREEKMIRGSGNQDWKPSWKNTIAMRQYRIERACHVTTRSGAKDGTQTPRNPLRKNSGKKEYKPKSRKRPVKPSQKPRKIQDPNKSVEDYIEDIRIDDQIKILTWKYYTREMATEVTENLTAKEKEKFDYDKSERVWKYFGRMLERREIEYRDVEVDEFLDSSTISYVQPVAIATDPIVFQIIMNIHWHTFPHKGVRSTNRILANILYVIRGGYVVRSLRDQCQRCRIILKNHIRDNMGDIPPEKLIVSPAFSFVQIDTCGPFQAYSKHGKRSVIEINALVLVCITTGAVSILALETLEAPSVVKALVRHSCRYGYPIVGFTDKGPGLKKGLGVQVELINHERLINKETGMKIVLKPTQSHESRGKVEKVVQTMKKYIQERKGDMLTQSLMDWETTFCLIGNYMNNLPMSRMNNSRNLSYDVSEIITPNRLLLGKNNQRSPNCVIEEKGVTYKERISKNNKIVQAFFTLLNRLTPDLIERPKWHKSSEILPQVGDYCLFCHRESSAGAEHEKWKIGRIIEIKDSESNSKTKIYVIEYRTAVKQKKKKAADWKVTRLVTDRHPRELVILFTMEELSSELGSEEHLARLKEKISQGPKDSSEKTGKNVRKRRVPRYKRF